MSTAACEATRKRVQRRPNEVDDRGQQGEYEHGHRGNEDVALFLVGLFMKPTRSDAAHLDRYPNGQQLRP